MSVQLSILAWLLVPLAVTVVALFVVGWRARPKRPADAHEGMAGLVRFREAMDKPLPTTGPKHSEEPDHHTDADSSQRGAA